MTPLEQARATLDGVEPDGFIYAYQGQEMALSRTMQPAGIPPSLYWQQPLYSRETVESLLQAHELRIRKQVLLEAAELQDKLAYGVAGAGVFPELLRRMAEGEE